MTFQVKKWAFDPQNIEITFLGSNAHFFNSDTYFFLCELMLCGLTLLWTKQFILCVKKGIWPLKHPKNALYFWLYSFKESYQKPHSEDGHWPLAWRQNCASILLMHVHTGSLLFFLDQATGWICPNWNYILLHAFIHHVFNLNILRVY